MSQATAQVLLTSLFLLGAIIFVVLGQDALAVGLVGAIAGQSATVGVNLAVNGSGEKR
jgi:p-aminobenzoyl-glutamate transporter AbgT